MYMVTSKPKRRSAAAGLVHMAESPLSGCGAAGAASRYLNDLRCMVDEQDIARLRRPLIAKYVISLSGDSVCTVWALYTRASAPIECGVHRRCHLTETLNVLRLLRRADGGVLHLASQCPPLIAADARGGAGQRARPAQGCSVAGDLDYRRTRPAAATPPSSATTAITATTAAAYPAAAAGHNATTQGRADGAASTYAAPAGSAHASDDSTARSRAAPRATGHPTSARTGPATANSPGATCPCTRADTATGRCRIRG